MELDTVVTSFISYSNVPASTNPTHELIAATSRSIFKAQIFDTTGSFFGIYTGKVGEEEEAFLVGPGSNESIPIVIPTGTRVSIRSLASAPVSGSIAINFLG